MRLGNHKKTVMTFTLFNQLGEYKSVRKKGVQENKNGVTGAKANL